jgi:hypothetical protein
MFLPKYSLLTKTSFSDIFSLSNKARTFLGDLKGYCLSETNRDSEYVLRAANRFSFSTLLHC